MKKIIYVILFLTCFILVLYLFYPRKAINAVVFDVSSKNINLYINGKQTTFKNNNSNIAKTNVIDCKYNKFFIYSIKIKEPIKNRVMLRKDTYYELEGYGNIDISDNLYIYNENNGDLIPSNSKNIIVGKENLDIYLDENNHLNTFIVHSIDLSAIRVGISSQGFKSIYHDNLTIQPSSGFKIYSYSDDININFSKSEVIHITSANDEMLISINEKNYTTANRIYIENSDFTLSEIQRGYPQFAPVYEGCIEVLPTKEGLVLINEVPLENYLSKVVPSEMPPKGGIESLKCQAVAARTYAISDMLNSRFAYLGFHVDDSTRSQVYNNTLPVDLTTQAVNETQGVIMTYNDAPIDAKYYSTSSGFGTQFKNIWYRKDTKTTDVPYLENNNFLTSKISVPRKEEEWLKFYKSTSIESYDSVSPYYRWQLSYDKNVLEKILYISLKDRFYNNSDFVHILVNEKEKKIFPENLGSLIDIKIADRATSGNIMEISFIFENAQINVEKDVNIRRCFNSGANITSSPINITKNDSSIIENWSTLPSSFFTIKLTENDVTLYGGGFGHGVGMSQYGAIYLSLQGYKYEEILKLYYKGVNIERIY